MADEDKIVKAGIEATLEPFANLLEKIAGPAAEELGLALREHVRFLRMKRQVRLWQRTKEFLDQAGIEPKRVPLKLLAPIMESGSLEEDDPLQDRWAALLANAAAGKQTVHPAFPEMLKQLSAMEVVMLEILQVEYNAWSRAVSNAAGDYEVEQEGIYYSNLQMAVTDEAVKRGFAKSRKELYRGTVLFARDDNLERLGLMSRFSKHKDRPELLSCRLTSLGHIFVTACTEPNRIQKIP